jgi:hypothetical protein
MVLEPIPPGLRATAGEWLVEKTGIKSPSQARGQWLAQTSLTRAA